MPLKVYDLLVDVKRPSGYRGSLVNEGEGSFVRLWVLAENPEDAVAVLRGYLKEDGAEFQTIEELSLVEEYQAAREFL